MSIFCPAKIGHCLMSSFTCFLVGLTSLSSLHGQELDQVLTHVDDETSALVRIDSATIDALLGDAAEGDDPEQTVLQLRLKQVRELLDGDPIWLTVGFPQTPLSIQILVRDPDGKRVETLKELWDFPKRPPFGPEPSVVMRKLSEPDPANSIDPAQLEKWKRLIPERMGNEQGSIAFACLPPAHLYETYDELLTELPDNLGGGPISLLTDGLQSISGSFDARTGALESTIKSASPEAAAAFAERATQLFTALKSASPDSDSARRIQPLIQQFGSSVFQSTEGNIRWQISASESWQPEKMLELAFGSASNRSAMKRLRILALGILNYESARRHLPPPADSRGPEKANSLSWRVHILPFLGKEELKLYKQFKFDEPWDSPHNIKLLPEMPNVYSEYGSKLFAPANAKPGYTTVVAPISENTILGAPKKVTFGSIVDGSSNTIILVIVKDSLAVPWTAPQDYVFDLDQPAAGLKFTDDRTPVSMCDGSQTLLIEENNWAALFEMNDGEVANPKVDHPKD